MKECLYCGTLNTDYDVICKSCLRILDVTPEKLKKRDEKVKNRERKAKKREEDFKRKQEEAIHDIEESKKKREENSTRKKINYENLWLIGSYIAKICIVVLYFLNCDFSSTAGLGIWLILLALIPIVGDIFHIGYLIFCLIFGIISPSVFGLALIISITCLAITTISYTLFSYGFFSYLKNSKRIIVSLIVFGALSSLTVLYSIQNANNQNNLYHSGSLLPYIQKSSNYNTISHSEDTNTTSDVSGSQELIYDITGRTYIIVNNLTSPVSKGATASITIQGEPNSEYRINVIYDTVISKAQGLYNKYSDENGFVEWSWKVGTRTYDGTYTIKICKCNNSNNEFVYKIPFEVY